MLFVERIDLPGELGQTLTASKRTSMRPMALQYAVSAVLKDEYGVQSFPAPGKEVDAEKHKAVATRIMNTANSPGWATNPGYTWEPVFTLAEATRDLKRRGYRPAAAAARTPAPVLTPTARPAPATVAVEPPVRGRPSITPVVIESRTPAPVLPTTIYSAPDPYSPELRQDPYSIEPTSRQISPGAIRSTGIVKWRPLAMQGAITEVLKREGLDPSPFSTKIEIPAARHTAIARRIMQTANEPGWLTYPGQVWKPPFTLAEAVKELKGRGYWPETVTAAPPRTPIQVLPRVAVPAPVTITPTRPEMPYIPPVVVTVETPTVDLPLWPPDSPVSIQAEPTIPTEIPRPRPEYGPPGPAMQQQQTVQIVTEAPAYPPPDVTTFPPIQEPPYFPPMVEPLYEQPPELPLPPIRPIEAEPKSKAWVWALGLVVLVLATGDEKAQRQRQAA